MSKVQQEQINAVSQRVRAKILVDWEFKHATEAFFTAVGHECMFSSQWPKMAESEQITRSIDFFLLHAQAHEHEIRK